MATPGTFAIHTLGCKLNYAESSTLGRQLMAVGWVGVEDNQPADLYILNTCSVTEFADKKCRQAIRRFKRNSPDSRVIVTGCYAQLNPEDLTHIEGVDLVLGAAAKFDLLRYVEDLQLNRTLPDVIRSEISEHTTYTQAHSYGSRTRSFIKVQDGCDYKCSFCTIPLARGGSRSATRDSILQEAESLLLEGVQEIVLTGVNTGDFGINDSGQRVDHFIHLLTNLDEVGIPRIRISSIEPNLCHEEIIHFIAESNHVMPHLHMPLQSGSDHMLSLMRRRYRSRLYADRVQLIKRLMPHAAIGVDVIVGFHGEDDARFDESMAFLRHLDVSYLHVFTYSERKDTHAMKMDNIVPMEVRRSRSQRMRLLSDKKRHNFYQSHIGDERSVLIEERVDGMLRGYTDNYIRVRVHCDTWEESAGIKQCILTEFHQSGELSASPLIQEAVSST